MSYDISLYRIETKEKQEASDDEDFFEKEDNLVAFTEQQFRELYDRLLKYGYLLSDQNNNVWSFNHPDEDYGTALLTKNALFFRAGWTKDSIFEVGMTASEFRDSGEYAKYDWQNGEWESWE